MTHNRIYLSVFALLMATMGAGEADAQTRSDAGKWANVLRFQWSLDGPAPGSTSRSPARESGRFSDVVLTVTKDVDGASPVLAEGCALGMPVESLRLYASTQVRDERQYYAYDLRSVTVTGYAVLGADDGRRPAGLPADVAIEVVTLRVGSASWGRVSEGAWGRVAASSWGRIGSATWGRIGSTIWGRELGAGVWGRVTGSETWGRSLASAVRGQRSGNGMWGQHAGSGVWAEAAGSGVWGQARSSGLWERRSGASVWGHPSGGIWLQVTGSGI